VGREAYDSHDLGPGGLAVDDLDPRAGATEALGQERTNGIVRRAVRRRGPDP